MSAQSRIEDALTATGAVLDSYGAANSETDLGTATGVIAIYQSIGSKYIFKQKTWS